MFGNAEANREAKACKSLAPVKKKKYIHTHTHTHTQTGSDEESGTGFSERAFLNGLRPSLPAAVGNQPGRHTFPVLRDSYLVRISRGGSQFGTSDGGGRFSDRSL